MDKIELCSLFNSLHFFFLFINGFMLHGSLLTDWNGRFRSLGCSGDTSWSHRKDKEPFNPNLKRSDLQLRCWIYSFSSMLWIRLLSENHQLRWRWWSKRSFRSNGSSRSVLFLLRHSSQSTNTTLHWKVRETKFSLTLLQSFCHITSLSWSDSDTRVLKTSENLRLLP